MAHHHIYHTEGIILSSRARGEANKIITVYTLEHGLIHTVVQGVRLNKSKLRFALQDLSYAKVDLVRGRDVWRITSATPVNSFPYARANNASLTFILRVCKLIERLCNGEEGNTEVFHDVLQAFILLDTPTQDTHTMEALELHLVLRILYHLGYIGESDNLAEYLGGNFTTEKVPALLNQKKPIVLAINNALRESQL